LVPVVEDSVIITIRRLRVVWGLMVLALVVMDRAVIAIVARLML